MFECKYPDYSGRNEPIAIAGSVLWHSRLRARLAAFGLGGGIRRWCRGIVADHSSVASPATS